MRAALPALLLAPLLAPWSPAASLAPPGVTGFEASSHAELVFQHDADGGISLRTLIDDHPDGSYVYTKIDVSNLNTTLGGLLGRVSQALGEEVAHTPMPLDEAGAYEHRWTRAWGAGQDSPMVTFGIYTKSRDGVVRVPLALFENVTELGDVANLTIALLRNDGRDIADNIVPFLLEFVDPLRDTHFSVYPEPGTLDAYARGPIVYAWLARKIAPSHEVWFGLYVERSGSFEGSQASGEDATATKTIDVGVAARVDAAPTLHLAGAWLRHDIEKRGGSGSQDTRSLLTVGTSGPQGRTALAALEGSDVRRDARGDLDATPDFQETGFSVGAMAGSTYTPLLGARTTMWTSAYTCPVQPEGQPNPQQQCLAVERLTSLGVYLQGTYTPLAGFRYRGDRNPPVPWLTGLVSGGGPGAQSIGDFDIDVGPFVQGAYQPLLGAKYRDRFGGGQRPFQGMLSAGAFGPDGYQAVLGVTYDGERPLLAWVQAYQAGNRAERGDWLASAGTFVGQQYVPLVGARYQDNVAGASHADQQHFALGVFLGRYDAFVPILFAAYDGDRAAHDWIPTFITTGTLGGGAGNLRFRTGAWANGNEVPLAGVEYRDDYGSGWPRQGFLVLGLYGPGGFVPLVGVSYSGEDSLVGSVNNPATTTDDDPVRLTVGVFVQGQYVPLVGVVNNREETSVALVPPWY